ncbi:competence protein ComG [Jeotgalibacillus sp. S-D1]|uniref:ComZ family protein n=1 Tax=Jeotgalibacillus sp. S-D1 TaxID=2552189 RepID=UPI001059C2A0|nr:ComZ family protein [Jeotgalibacillus sp. S-D1]TDL35329.1 competence protein ComG [Jeotgalibacillus sp. S-D1]
MTQDKTMEFMQIAMKYLPEAKERMEQAGIEVSIESLQPFMGLFAKAMNDAYELGKKESLENN